MRYQITVEKIQCDCCSKVVAKANVICDGNNDFCSEECVAEFKETERRQGKLFSEKSSPQN